MSPGGEPDVSVPARAIGEPHRALILTALLHGRQLPAGELARLAQVAPATASEHLRLLQDAGLVAAVRQGRHRYYGLASPAVAQALEALQAVSPVSPVSSLRRSRITQDLHQGRRCYDHLAGGIGMRVTGILQGAGIVPSLTPGVVVSVPDPLPTCDVSTAMHLELRPPASSRRPWARGCLDWTHRLPHLAGYLGAAVMESLSDQGWIRPSADSRAVSLTAEGAEAFAALEHLTSPA